jgi:MinD-like ATPase involved in chromosome partitioning or flagellar assembly
VAQHEEDPLVTGRHEEPEARPEAQWYPPAGSAPAPVDYGMEHPSGPQRFEHPSGPQRIEPPAVDPQQPTVPHPAQQTGVQQPSVQLPGLQQPGLQQPAQPGVQHGVSRQPGGVQSPYHPHAVVQQTPYQQHLSREAMAPAHDLSSAQLLRQQKRPPQSGWRRAVYVASGRSVNLGESPGDRVRRELITRINQPLQGCYKIAMLSLKGGVGKTTTTTALGSTFASLRGDRVIAVDANPDRGTLSQKIPLETTATVRHLLRDAQRIRRYSDVRSYTSQGPSRLEVLASEQDPAVSEAFSEDDYRRTVMLLEHFYNIVLTDCGTGLMHSAMKGVLDLADSLVVVSSGSIDGARSASATLDWLDAHGYRALVARSVAVINSVRPRSGKVDLNKVAEHFAARCRAVCRIPFDPHLEEGAEIELDQLHPATRLAMLELGATVADDFPHAVARAQRR